MNPRRIRLKPKLSVNSIGKLRFWTGLIIGITYAILICLFFNYSRELLRSQTGNFSDLIILDPKTAQFFNIFFATFSTSIGFSLTVWFWMSNRKNKFFKHRLLKGLSIVNSIMILWIPLLILTRIGYLLFILVYSSQGYDSDLSLISDFRLLFLLLPLVVFLHNWIIIRRMHKTKHWMGLSFVICLGISLVNYHFASVNTEKVDNIYKTRFSVEYQVIQDELEKSKNNYGISFYPSTIMRLKERYTSSSFEQIEEVKKAFMRNRNVSLDTIILQKIIVKNFKQGRWYPEYNSIQNWPYATPQNVFDQIILNKNNSTVIRELENILNEYILLVNYINLEVLDYESLNFSERRRIFGAKNRIPKILVEQLVEVRNELISISESENIELNLNELQLKMEN